MWQVARPNFTGGFTRHWSIVHWVLWANKPQERVQCRQELEAVTFNVQALRKRDCRGVVAHVDVCGPRVT